MQDLFRLLPTLLKEVKDDEKLRQIIVFAAWRKIAGESLSAHAVPVLLNKKQLVVAVANDRWEKYVKDLSSQMIFKLNSSLHRQEVTFIQFIVDEEAVLKAKKSKSDDEFDELELRELALQQLSPTLRAKSHAIKDESLRQEFLKAASMSLARKKKLKDSKD
ncbi:MAG: DUF721 domain-containing protein [Pyrinomonadaceae bacterium]|jgi:hypothetical protein|nr:DUF721 domain-containing protein [Pyrinomonadaceae bacterium]